MCLYKFQSCSQYDTIGNQQLNLAAHVPHISEPFFSLTSCSSSELWLRASPPLRSRRAFFNSGVALPARAAQPELETGSEAPRQVVEQWTDTRTSALSLRSAVRNKEWSLEVLLDDFKRKIRLFLSSVNNTFYFLQVVKTQHTQKDPTAVRFRARL